MMFRYWLADLISGGEFSRLATRCQKENNRTALHMQEFAVRTMEMQAAQENLARIAALETPKANATVRNMARIARGEKKWHL